MVLVTHSMGCVYSLYFLNQMDPDWVAKYIKVYVPISGPWQGAVQLLRALVAGYNEGIPFVSELSARQAQVFFKKGDNAADESNWSRK